MLFYTEHEMLIKIIHLYLGYLLHPWKIINTFISPPLKYYNKPFFLISPQAFLGLFIIYHKFIFIRKSTYFEYDDER